MSNKEQSWDGFQYYGLLGILIFSGLLLVLRLGYYFIADTERFPINTIKVAASYEHITHQELEKVLAQHVDKSYFTLSLKKLQRDLNTLSWLDSVNIERVWPDTLKIKLVEKKPIAVWGNALMTADGRLFNEGQVFQNLDIPHLKGPITQHQEVLQVYEKLSKILTMYGLNAVGLHLRENQSWVLLLTHDIKVYLGKNELETRLLRFCKAYPAVFAEKMEQLASVDLRYPRGMAVQWKQQTER